ncbi:MAG: efflux RND transporter periplasmic adaptor subunit [Pseudomonadota bacterium]
MRTATLARVIGAAACPLLLAACFPEEEAAEEDAAVRGLITRTVSEIAETTVRRYPGVLEPGEVNVLGFEVGGRLGRVALDVGERVSEGQLLATLDIDQFQTTVENRKAAVEEAVVTLSQAEDDLARSEQLLERGAVTVVRRDEDRTEVMQRRAQLTQARMDLSAAEEDLADASLYAPFAGVIDAIEVESFATVSAGQTVLSLYQQADFEVAFTASFDVVGRLVVGTPASVRLADDPSVRLAAVVSELGERADTVSAFPVVVRLQEVSPLIKAGMAVEVSFEFDVPMQGGHLVPISAAVPGGPVPENAGPDDIVGFEVFVLDPETSTVRRRAVKMAGIRGNEFLIVEGLEAGEQVAIKGVTFLRDGMQVTPLPEPEAR